MYCFAFINTYNYSFNFLYYVLNNLVTKNIFEAMLIHVLASGVSYTSYLIISSKIPISNKHFFNDSYSLKDWKYLLFPSMAVYVFSILMTKSTYNQILANAQDFAYNNTISNLLYPFKIFIYSIVIKLILTNKKIGLTGSFFLIFFLSSELLRAFLGGSKAGILGILVFLSLIYLFKKSINIKALILIILLIIPNIFFFISMANIRNSIQRDNMWATMGLLEKVQYVYEESIDLNYFEAAGKLSETIANRLHGVRSLAVFMERTPAVYGYWDGASYMNVLKSSIPRIMWKEKNMDDVANTISYNYFDSAFTTNVSPFVWGEPYLNFGVTGVLLFACLISVLLKCCDIILRKFSGDFFVQVFIVFIVYSYIGYEGNAARIIPGIISQTIFFLAFYLALKIIRLSVHRISS